MLSRVQVRGRLLLAFFAVASFAVLAAAAALYSFLQVGGALNLITQERVPSALASQELSRQAERIVAIAPALLAVGADEQHARVSAEIAAEVRRLNDLLTEVELRSADAPMMDDILGQAELMEANLEALDALVASRLAAGARKGELLRQLADIGIAIQRLLGPEILAREAEIYELRSAAREPNLPADAWAEAIERRVASIAEGPQLQRARSEALAINRALLQTASAASLAELEVLKFPLYRSLSTLDNVAADLDGGLGGGLAEQAKQVRGLVEEPDSIPGVREGELAIIADIESRLAKNTELSALLTAALDQLVAAANTDIREANLEALSVQRASTAILAIVVGLSLVSSILIVWLYVGRNLIARLTSLNQIMMAIAGGRLDADIPAGGGDEISDMARALTVFRGTAIEAREAGRALREAKENLEIRVAERTEALKQRTALVQMLYRLTISADDADDPDEAMKACLEVVCEYTGWPIGHVYLASADGSGKLTPSGIWHLKYPERFETFRDVTEKSQFAPGVGLPGRVLASGKPAWIVDVTKEPNFPRAKLAEEIGVRSGFALPVLVGRKVPAVLEFFSDEIVDPDELLFQALASVGTQLGRVVERKETESALLTAKTEAEEATKMKSRFLANMSHELRTPLTSIKGSLSLIASGTAGEVPEDVAALVKIADDSAGSLVDLINDILDFEKIRAGQLVYAFEPLDVRGVVEQAIEANRTYGDQFGVTFELQPAEADHVRVKGDRNRLIQVMTNLLSNAAKYSPDGGAVEVSIERRAPSIRVSVRDRGPGIPEEYRKHMFGEFYQVYEKDAGRRSGTGLGLSIAKSIIAGHGGSIDYSTKTDVGTTFFFDLPELRGRAPNSARPAAAPSGPGRAAAGVPLRAP